MSATYIHTKRKPGYSKLILRFLAILYIAGVFLSIAYLWIFTQDRFISTAEFKVSKQNLGGNELSFAQLALPGLSDSGSVDSQIVIGYINSADLLLELENEFKLLDHYNSPSKDFIFRLDRDANLEERLKFYRSRITAHFDVESGMTVITVDTFDPEFSRKIARTLLARAETYINKINHDVADQQLSFVRSEVEGSAKKVEELNAELIAMQNANNFITPQTTISTTLAAVEKMRMEYFKTKAELATIQRESPNAPRIDSLNSQLRSLDELITTESAKLSGTEKDRLNQLLVRFKMLEHKIEFALKLRAGAEAMLEKNRVDAISRSRFLTVIQHPYLPENVSLPRRPYATVTILVLGGLLFFILRAVTKSIFSII